MKTSSPTSPKSPQPKSILLIGPPGSRKTTLGMQFPSLYILDWDMNLDGPDRANRLVNKNLSYSYDTVTADESGKLKEPGDWYDNGIMLLKKVSSEPDIKWLMLDGLTTINESIVRKIMKEQQISYLEARNWSTFKTDAISLLFTKLRYSGKNVIVTAHEVENEKNDPKNVMSKILLGYEPFIQSGVKDMLGGFFTDVWRLTAEPAPGGKIETTLRTDKDPMMKQLKNSVGLPVEIKNPTYAEISRLCGGLI